MGDRVRRHTIEIMDNWTGTTLLFAGADWTRAHLKDALNMNLRLAPAATRHNRYSIEIKDVTGRTSLYASANWGEKELETAIELNIRLAGLPHGKERPAPADDEDP